MNCPYLAEIYDYLEKEMTAEKSRAIEEHISCCSACQKVVEDRRRFLAACSLLPDLPLPAGWARAVMAKITRLRPSSLIWFMAILSSLSLLLAGLGYMIISLLPGVPAPEAPDRGLALLGLIRAIFILTSRALVLLLVNLGSIFRPLYFTSGLPGHYFSFLPLEFFFGLILAAAAIFLVTTQAKRRHLAGQNF